MRGREAPPLLARREGYTARDVPDGGGRVTIASPDPTEPITVEQWTQIRAAWPNAERLRAAWNLALDVDTLADLIVGRPVSPGRLDKAELAKARQATLVVLRRPIDLLLEGAA
jgi:hypothetical protein